MLKVSSEMVFFLVPGGGAGGASRRHSYQSGVPGLAKDMDRLKVSAAAGVGGCGSGSGSGSSRGVSPRGSTKRRPSTVRRSSRSGKSPAM